MAQQEDVQGLDAVLEPIGGFGKFQMINILCICSMITLCAFSELGYVFTAGEVKHRCFIPECESNSSTCDYNNQQWVPSYIPKTATGTYESCLRYNTSSSTECGIGFQSSVTYQCREFTYESNEWTINREDWGIHCDQDRYWLNLVGSLNNAGQVIGTLIVGYLTDRFGRRVMIIIALLVTVISIIKSFSINYSMMVTLELVGASLAIALFNGPFVLALEIVSPSKRVLASTLVFMAYPLGEIILGIVQLLTLDWRTTLRILYAPFFLTISYYWIVPESARWLLNNDRPDDAINVLETIAKTNGKVLTEQAVREVLKDQDSKKSARSQEENVQESNNHFIELFNSKTMRLRVLAWLFIWLFNTFVFFGMTLNSVSVNNDKFLNFILTCLMEIPAYILMYLILDRLGRRLCQSGALLFCGVACIFDAFVPDDPLWSWVKLMLYLFGKFNISISTFVVDVYTTELFPTPIRSTMMSTGLLAGKLATILAPEVPLLAHIYTSLPLLLFGGMATVAGLAALTLPETLNSKLPDTMEEAENLGKQPLNNSDITLTASFPN